MGAPSRILISAGSADLCAGSTTACDSLKCTGVADILHDDFAQDVVREAVKHGRGVYACIK
jgi:hypothetical protein